MININRDLPETPPRKKGIFFGIKSRIMRQLHRGVAFNVGAIVVFLWALSLLTVIIWGINISFTEGVKFYLDPNRFFPEEWYFGNYGKAFSTIGYQFFNTNTMTLMEATYLSMLGNSIWFSVGSTFMKLLATMCFAYVIGLSVENFYMFSY